MKQGKASLFMLLACGLTAPMFSLIKWASQLAPIGQVIYFHYIAALIVTGALLLIARPKTWRIQGKRLFSLRAFFWLITTLCIFNASAFLPVVHVSLLLNTAPLFVPLLALFFLNERISAYLWGAIFIAFMGTALVLKPSGGIDLFGALIAFTGALAAAGSMVSTQRLVEKNSALLLSFYLLLIGVVMTSCIMPFIWQSISLKPILLALFSGTIFAIELYSFTKAFAYGSATRLGPFNYAGVVISGLVSWLAWGDKLDLFAWLGIGLVCLGGSLSFLIPRAQAQTT